MITNNPLCPKCGGQSYKRDKKRTNRLYSCKSCKKYFTPGGSSISNPPCSYCKGRIQKRGTRYGVQQYSCSACKRYLNSLSPGKYFKPKPPVVALSPAELIERQIQARLLGDSLPQIIDSNVPKSLPPDIRDEVTQELALAALYGEVDLNDLSQVVPRFRRKAYNQMLIGYRYISLDAPIPHTDGLTYADCIAG